MSISETLNNPLARYVSFTETHFIVNLTDGRSLSIPLDWSLRLLHATPLERANWYLVNEGEAIAWPDLDEHIGVVGLIAGERSKENIASVERWMESRRNQSIRHDAPLRELAA